MRRARLVEVLAFCAVVGILVGLIMVQMAGRRYVVQDPQDRCAWLARYGTASEIPAECLRYVFPPQTAR